MATKPQTLADTLEALSRADVLDRTRADLQSAIRCFCRVTDLDPAATPADDLANLQKHIASAMPARHGVAPARWSVIRSQVQRALALTGAALPLRTATTQLSPGWERLLGSIGPVRQRHALSRFARFCCQTGKEPDGVTQESFDRFHGTLTTGSLVRNPDDVHRTAVRVWCALPDTIAGFTLARIASVEPPTPKASGRIPLSDFPASLQEDLKTFKRWCVSADPLDDHARPQALRPQSVISYCSSIHTAADAAVRAGTPIEIVTAIAVLMTPDMYMTILRRLLADHGQKASPTLHAVATVLLIMAKDWLRQSPEQIAGLKRIKAKLPKLKPGLTRKNRDLLGAFDDQKLLSTFLFLPDRLWEEALPDKLPPHQRLVTAQMALLIAILQITPLRRRNICAVVFDRHIAWPNGPKAPALIQVPSSEMKTVVDYVGELPVELSRRLHHYRTKLVPAITGKVPSHLFVKTDGKPKREESVTNRLVVTLEKRLGLHMTMHQFRHMSGKLMLDRYPGAYETVAQTLGHTGTKNVVKFYGGVDTRRASRHNAKLIETLRDQNRASHRKSGKS